MGRILVASLTVVLFSSSALGICALPGPPGEITGKRDPTDPQPTPPAPGEGTPSPGPAPTPTPTPAGEGPASGGGGSGDPIPAPGAGDAPSPNPAGPAGGRGAARSPRRGLNYAPSWRIWWELNREYIFGLRKTSPETPAAAGRESAAAKPVPHRDRVRESLRAVAFRGDENRELRSTALRALGRAGTEADAKDFLRILQTAGLPGELYEGAAFGVASLREIRDEEIRRKVREYFTALLRGEISYSGRSGRVAILAGGLRARHDEGLTRAYAERLALGANKVEDAASLLLACGISRSEFLTGELERAARSGDHGRKHLQDVARAHAVLALAMSGGGKTARTLAELLVERKVQVHTRRSAALGLGLLLREGSVDGLSDKDVQRALHHCFEKEHDELVKGYCAIAMGAAKRPFLTGKLVRLIDKTGTVAVKPYAAVALGLAARTLGGEGSTKIREYLVSALPKARNDELAGALCIALGLAKATESRDLLFEIARDSKRTGSVRGTACQALGLLGNATPEIERFLLRCLEDADHTVVEDAALALGFIGSKGTAEVLVKKLAATRSAPVLIHMVVALSHLGDPAAIEPLLRLLEDRATDRRIRESAATTLGILLDPRERDPLFEIDAYASPYGLTYATRELVRIY